MTVLNIYELNYVNDIQNYVNDIHKMCKNLFIFNHICGEDSKLMSSSANTIKI